MAHANCRAVSLSILASFAAGRSSEDLDRTHGRIKSDAKLAADDFCSRPYATELGLCDQLRARCGVDLWVDLNDASGNTPETAMGKYTRVLWTELQEGGSLKSDFYNLRPILRNSHGHYLWYAKDNQWSISDLLSPDKKLQAFTGESSLPDQLESYPIGQLPDLKDERLLVAGVDPEGVAHCPQYILGGAWFVNRQPAGSAQWEENPAIMLTWENKGRNMYDLHNHKVKKDAVYHAYIKLGIGDKAVMIEMSPSAIASIVSPNNNELRTEEGYIHFKDFTLFVADDKQGYAASCQRGSVYDSSSLKIRGDVTFRTLAKKMTKFAEENPWSPGSYNCQNFAMDTLAELASEPERMKALLDTLTHDAPALTLYNTVLTDAAGRIARATQGVVQATGVLHIPLSDVSSHSGMDETILDLPIDSVRLYYTETAVAHLLTNEESRTADFEERHSKMCELIEDNIEGSETPADGELVRQATMKLKDRL